MASRTAILDAAHEILVARGWGAARMADVAARVGVSRQTVYNEFGSKEGLARAVLLRETGRYLDAVSGLLDSHAGDPERGIEAAALFTLVEAADNPLLKAVLTASGNELLPLMTTRSEWLLVASRAVIVDSLTRHLPDLSEEDVAMVAEAAVRLTVSHLVLSTEPPETTARRLARLVSGYLRSTGGVP